MIRNRIKELRKHLKLNQADFALSIGIKQGSLSDIETGKTAVTQRMMTTICAVYNVNREWLETGKGEMILPGDQKETVREVRPQPHTRSPDLQLVLDQVYEIMISGEKTIADALKQNVVAFHASVKTMQQNKKLTRTAKENRALIDDLRRKMDALEKFLNPHDPPSNAKAE